LDGLLDESDLGELEVDLIPKTDEAIDLGTPTNKWKDLYLAGDSIYLGDIVLRETEEGSLGVFGSDGETPASLEIEAGSITDDLLSDDEGQIKDVVSTKADKDNVLELDNTTEFTPSSDFHPSTKKYVDDTVSASEVNSIEDIGDVTITNPQDGESLVYDDGVWINSQVSGVQNIDAGSSTTVFSVADINISGGDSHGS
jgi:hypothetical protein